MEWKLALMIIAMILLGVVLLSKKINILNKNIDKLSDQTSDKEEK
jgi:hypothetical protein